MATERWVLWAAGLLGSSVWACGAGGSGASPGLGGAGALAGASGAGAGSSGAGSSGAGSSGAAGAGAGSAGAGGVSSGGASSGTGGASSAGTGGGGGTAGTPAVTERAFAYVGSYQNAIYVYSLDPATGALTAQGAPVQAPPSPSFLAFAPDRAHLYAVNEADDVDGTGAGAVSAFRIEPATGGLTFQNRISSGGAGPAHVAVDATGKYVLVANYNGGNFSVLSVGADGALLARVAGADHGAGAQTHEVVLDASNRFLFVVNKGRSDVSQYRFDATSGSVTPNTPPALVLAAGVGSRHLAFHPTLPYAYVVNELGDSVSVLTFDATDGTLGSIQTLSTLPAGADGAQNSGAEVAVAPSGQFVYASNRGNDSIVIYGVDPATGRLTLVGHQATNGDTPRSFDIDRSGAFMLVANQDSDEVVTFRVNATTGALTELTRVSVPSPAFVGVLYLPLP